MTANELFQNSVVPIMDKVAAELRKRQVEEYRREAFSFRGLMRGGVGPDGGMAADSTLMFNLKEHGEWNSKSVEDYVEMVKEELARQKIAVTPELEQMMIDKMVADNMPKSSIEYIMRKAAQSSIFSLPLEAQKSPLQHEIESKAEALYAPSKVEKGLGWGLGAAADFMAFGGTSLASGLKFVGVDMALNAGMEALEKGAENAEDGQQVASSEQKETCNPQFGFNEQLDVPSVVLPEYREQYLAENRKGQSDGDGLEDLNGEEARQSTENQEGLTSRAQVTASSKSPSKQSINDALKGIAQRSGGNMSVQSVDSERSYEAVDQVIDQEASSREKASQEVVSSEENVSQTSDLSREGQSSSLSQQQSSGRQQQAAPISLPPQTNTNGWQGVLSNFGLNGLGDIGRNMGYIIAMLPDMLVGLLTGKTKSLGLKTNLMPIASIMLGMFVKNPLLKMTLIGLGGANLLNKAGHEELDRVRGVEYDSENSWANTQQGQRNPVSAQGLSQSAHNEQYQQNQAQNAVYRPYAAEPLNPRLENPQIQGNVMVVSIDKIPVTITLPDKVVAAYQSGALPLSTLANAVLSKADQMQQLSTAQDRFEAETRTATQSLTQR